MKKSIHPTTVITVQAENDKGVLARILGTLDRPNYYVSALTMAKTDIFGQVVITMEIHAPLQEINNLLLRLEKIIEVEAATAHDMAVSRLIKSGVFEVSMEETGPDFWRLIQKFGATVTFQGNTVLVQKTAQAADLQEFYNQLDQVYLQSYNESAIAVI